MLYLYSLPRIIDSTTNTVNHIDLGFDSHFRVPLLIHLSLASHLSASSSDTTRRLEEAVYITPVPLMISEFRSKLDPKTQALTSMRPRRSKRFSIKATLIVDKIPGFSPF
jgi:hypothetical protein